MTAQSPYPASAQVSQEGLRNGAHMMLALVSLANDHDDNSAPNFDALARSTTAVGMWELMTGLQGEAAMTLARSVLA